MIKKIIFKKAGNRSFSEYDSDELLGGVKKVIVFTGFIELYRDSKVPVVIHNTWILEASCNYINCEFDRIMEYPFSKRKRMLGKYYGMEYIDMDSWRILFDEIERKKIPVYFGQQSKVITI